MATKRCARARARITTEERAEAIFRSAAEVICKKGFDATSMNDIAAAVKLTKAGLYYYTDSKRDLLYKIMGFAMDTVEESVVRPCQKISDPEERLRAVIHNHVKIVTTSGGALSILTDEVNCLSTANQRKIIKRKRNYVHMVRDTLEDLKAAGRLCNLDTTVATLNLFATILGVARWHRRKGKFSPEKIGDEVSEFILGGLLISR